MKHTGTVVLETERLILRPFVMKDAQAMFDNWANDEEVTRFMTWNPHQNVELTRSILADWVAQYPKENYYQWAICLKETPDNVIGSISAMSPDEKIKAAEIGYCIGKHWWGQGIMPEAFNEVIRLMFEQVGLNRIYAYYHSGNPNSGRVMEKCGLQREGYLRQSDLDNQGRLIDMVLYSILASDYYEGALDGLEQLR